MEKRKISYTKYCLKIQEANANLEQKFGRTIIIQQLYNPKSSLEVGINWRALGTQTAEETRLFINQLNEVTAIAKSLNEEFKDCEVDFRYAI